MHRLRITFKIGLFYFTVLTSSLCLSSSPSETLASPKYIIFPELFTLEHPGASPQNRVVYVVGQEREEKPLFCPTNWGTAFKRGALGEAGRAAKERIGLQPSSLRSKG